jgi:RNA polymerase sigma factor (TIGR02999 family)
VQPFGEITTLLAAVRQGDPDAENRLISLVYDDLHSLARRYMRRERKDHTLQPTALVHETYLRLMNKQELDIQDRAHFFATAATVMRRYLVDHARKHKAGKGPGAQMRVEMRDFLAATQPSDNILILDEALTRLEEFAPRQARIVVMIYFGGLTEREAAEALGISDRTVKREWAAARAWLQTQLRKDQK